MELTYTIELNDKCARPLQCSLCGQLFNVGDMIHEIPLYGKYDLFCDKCIESMGLFDDRY